jgi:hypothetical protein
MRAGKILALTGALCAMAVVTYAADVAGKWTAEFDTPIGRLNYTYEFQVDGDKLTGKATWQQGETQITEGKISGDEISFVENLDFDGQPLRIEYKGKVNGDEIQMTRQVGDFGTEQIVAKRVK